MAGRGGDPTTTPRSGAWVRRPGAVPTGGDAGRPQDARRGYTATRKVVTRAVLATLTLLLAAPVAGVAAPLLPLCSWPFEVTGHGLTNIATPDTNATYWIMPLDTDHWKTMVIHGKYPEVRFFNFSTYAAVGSFVDSALDRDIKPDADSTNPFASPIADEPHDYTLTIGGNAPEAMNTVRLAPGRVSFIVYRLYVPDQGVDRTGRVGVPAVTVMDASGDARELQPCPFTDTEASLSRLIILLRINGLNDAANFLQRILLATNQRPLFPVRCTPGQTGNAVSFAPATLNADFFANPVTTYLETPSLCLEANKVLVVRGQAPVFPNTYVGHSVFEPAFDTTIQMRYWSMCQNDRVIPYPVIGCQADFATHRDQTQSYTYVVSDDPAPPPWLPAGATWLPWGETSIPKNLIFRVTLPENSTATDYTPKGAFCDEALLTSQGWQACFTAAGVSTAQ